MLDTPPPQYPAGQPPHGTPQFSAPGGPQGGGNGAKTALIVIGSLVGVVLLLGALTVAVLLVTGGSDDERIGAAARDGITSYTDGDGLLAVPGLSVPYESSPKMGPVGAATVTSQEGSTANVSADGSITRQLSLPPFYDDGGQPRQVKTKVRWQAEMIGEGDDWATVGLKAEPGASEPAARPKVGDQERSDALATARRAVLAATNVGGAIGVADFDAKQPDVYLTGPGRKGLNATTDERAGFSRVLPPTAGPKGGIKATANDLVLARRDDSCFVDEVLQVRTTITGEPRFDARVKGSEPASPDLQVVWVSLPTKLSVKIRCNAIFSKQTRTRTFTPRMAVALVRPAVAIEGSDEWRVAVMKLDDPKAYAAALYEPFTLSGPFRPTGE